MKYLLLLYVFLLMYIIFVVYMTTNHINFFGAFN